jgi:hypothetical protein
MKFTATIKILIFVLISLFTQFSMAADNGSALSDIAGVVAGMNHFPSDADKGKLMMLSEDDSLAQGIRDMASTVANIQHFANDEGKEAMARIIANEQAPDRAKTLARIIAGFLHIVSAEDKATLEAML